MKSNLQFYKYIDSFIDFIYKVSYTKYNTHTTNIVCFEMPISMRVFEQECIVLSPDRLVYKRKSSFSIELIQVKDI